MARQRTKADNEGSDPLPTLPPGWAWTRVDVAGEVKLGRQRSPEHHNGPHMRPYLRVANVYEDRIDLSDVLQMNFSPQEYEIYALKDGDVLLNEGQSLELVGRPAMYRGELPGACFQNTLIRFRAREGVVPEFALLVFRHYVHSQRFQRIAKWTVNIAHLGAGRLAEVEFPLPPTNEQRRIAQKASEIFSQIDAGFGALQRVRLALRRYRAAVLKAAVEGRLTEAWRAAHPDTQPASDLLRHILAERRRLWEEEQQRKYQTARKEPPKGWREKYAEPIGPDLTDLQAVPPTWVVASLDQLTTTITSGSRDWSRFYGRGSGTFLMAQNVRPGKLDLSYRQAVDPPAADRDRLRSQVRKGDLLVTIVGANTGDVCRVREDLPEHYVCQSVALARPVDPRNSAFFEAYLISDDNGQRQFQRYIYGQGRPHLGFDELRGTAIFLPPLEEQAQILSEIEQRLSVIEELEALVEANLKRAARMRQSVLKLAFEGKLVPQDPGDEPAGALLRRIR